MQVGNWSTIHAFRDLAATQIPLTRDQARDWLAVNRGRKFISVSLPSTQVFCASDVTVLWKSLPEDAEYSVGATDPALVITIGEVAILIRPERGCPDGGAVFDQAEVA